MTTFLDHPACWRRAARFFYAEALPAWRKRTHLPHVPATVDEASLEALAAGLSTYFRRTEGRDTLSRRRDRRFPLTAVPVSILFVFVVPPRDRCSL